MSYNLSITVEDDWEKACPVTTIESGDSYPAPVTAALLIAKSADGQGISVSVAIDKSTDWTSHELVQALGAFVQDLATNTQNYAQGGPLE